MQSWFQPAREVIKELGLGRVRMDGLGHLQQGDMAGYHQHRFADQRIGMIGQQVYADYTLC